MTLKHATGEQDASYYDRIFSLYNKYVSELEIESLWCADAYAQTYLADIYNKVKELLSEYIEKNKYQSELPESIWFLYSEAQCSLRTMEIDFDYLTTKIFESPSMTANEREEIAKILNDKFYNVLEGGFKTLDSIYRYEMEIGLQEQYEKYINEENFEI